MVSLIQIFKWFKEGIYVSEDNFKQTWSSFWHKSERLPQEQILGLNDALNDKATKEELENATTNFKGYHTSLTALQTAYPLTGNKKDWFAWVGSPYPGTVYKVFADNGAWTDTGVKPTQQEINLAEYMRKDGLFSNASMPFVNVGTGYWTGTVGTPPTISTQYPEYRYMNRLSAKSNDTISFTGFNIAQMSNGLCVITDLLGNFVKRVNFSDCQAVVIATGSGKYTMPSDGFVYFYFNITGNLLVNNAFVKIGNSIIDKTYLPTGSTDNFGIVKISDKADNTTDFALAPKALFDLQNKLFVDSIDPTPIVKSFVCAGNGNWAGTAGLPPSVNTANAGWIYMDLIPVVGNTKIQFYGFYEVKSTNMLCIEIDKSGNYIRRVNFSDTIKNSNIYEYTLASNVSKIGVVFDTSGTLDYHNAYLTLYLAKAGFSKINPELLPDSSNTSVNCNSIYSTREFNPFGGISQKATNMFSRGFQKTLPDNILPTVLIIGQSNADGRAPLNTMPAGILNSSNELPNFMMWSGSSFSTYRIGYNTGAAVNNDVRFAFDVFFAIKYIETYGQLYAIKHTYSGTPITEKGTAWAARWQPFTERIAAGERAMCNELSAKVNNANNWAVKNNKILFPIAILYHQGEGDADRAGAGGVVDYPQNLSNLISYIRGLYNAPTLPFVNATLISSYSANYPLINNVFFQLNEVDRWMKTVDMKGHQTNLGDNLHYDAAALKYMGESMYELLENMN